MPEDTKANKTADLLFPPWLKASIENWSKLSEAAFPEKLKNQDGTNTRLAEQWQKNLNLIKSFSQIMNEPESAEAAAKAVGTLPELILKMARSGWEASFQIQQHIMEKVGKIGQRTEAYNFDNLDQDVFKALTDIYEKELQQYFNIPQLGLTRFYQERFNKFLDKKNIFESTLAEFLSVVYLPVEKSFKVLEEKLKSMAEQGILPKEVNETYAIWIKILEGHYMNLFKSREYTQILHDTISRMEDYLLARNNCIQDFLQLFPVPTNKEMDELYKEFHLLKKRVKELEKKVKQTN